MKPVMKMLTYTPMLYVLFSIKEEIKYNLEECMKDQHKKGDSLTMFCVEVTNGFSLWVCLYS